MYLAVQTKYPVSLVYQVAHSITQNQTCKEPSPSAYATH